MPNAWLVELELIEYISLDCLSLRVLYNSNLIFKFFGMISNCLRVACGVIFEYGFSAAYF